MSSNKTPPERTECRCFEYQFSPEKRGFTRTSCRSTTDTVIKSIQFDDFQPTDDAEGYDFHPHNGTEPADTGRLYRVGSRFFVLLPPDETKYPTPPSFLGVDTLRAFHSAFQAWKAPPSDTMCIVCWETTPNIRLACGHRVLCDHCVMRLPRGVCPACRKPIQPWPLTMGDVCRLLDTKDGELFRSCTFPRDPASDPVGMNHPPDPTDIRSLQRAMRWHAETIVHFRTTDERKQELISILESTDGTYTALEQEVIERELEHRTGTRPRSDDDWSREVVAALCSASDVVPHLVYEMIFLHEARHNRRHSNSFRLKGDHSREMYEQTHGDIQDSAYYAYAMSLSQRFPLAFANLSQWVGNAVLYAVEWEDRREQITKQLVTIEDQQVKQALRRESLKLFKRWMDEKIYVMRAAGEIV